MKKTSFLSILLLGAALVSCKKNFLDRYPMDEVTDANYWETEDHIKYAANACYANIKSKNTVDMENMGDNTVWPTVTDYQRIGSGNFGNDLAPTNTEWANMYDAVARCNMFLANYKKAKMPETLRERYAGEVRFIRAYLYSYLTLFYGDVQLIDKPLVPGDPELYGTRQPRAEGVDFMLKDLDSAAVKLPVTYTDKADYGRITKGAALALKARVALYNQRWEVAAKAAQDVIDLKWYSLYDNGNKSTSYWELFSYKGEQSKNAANRESILVRLCAPELSMHNLSREIQVPDQEIRWNPTKSLVDAYLCTDGKTIQNSTLYKEEKYTDVWENRDPRMAQTILKPGSAWKGLDDGDADNLPNTVYNLPKFRSDKKGAVTVTGYYFTKYCEPTAVSTVSKDETDIILIRYAEVLLTLAEAKMELGTLTQADLDETINKLRERVGMHPMLLSELTAWNMDLREEIRRERRVELALEGQRYFDILRWKQGNLLAADIKGMKKSFAPVPADVANRPTDADGYIIFSSNRKFEDPKNYLWPISLVQFQRNPNLGQNTGWTN